MIGHTKASSGAAGLIKTALSLYHKVLPPTLKAETPDPGLDIDNSHFYLNTTTQPWFSPNGNPRRAGVSAFGFGGSNFHVVLEEYHPEKSEISWDGSVDIIAFSAYNISKLARKVRHYKDEAARSLSHREPGIKAAESRRRFSPAHPYRLLIVRDQESERSDLFDRALGVLDSGDVGDKIISENIFFGGPEIPGKLAFVFPGQGSQYLNMGRDVVCTFPQAMQILAKANKKFDGKGLLNDLIFPQTTSWKQDRRQQEATLRRTDTAQPAIGAISLAMLNVLRNFDVSPDATCGHSFGELTALCAAGWIDEDGLLELAIKRGRLMADAGGNHDPPDGAMLAVFAPLNDLEDLLETSNLEVVLANRNSPGQGVLSGPAAAIAEIEKICKQKKINAIRLPVSAAFHSDLVKTAGRPFRLALKKVAVNPTAISVFSNTTGQAYPPDASETRSLLGSHLTRPVDFVSEIENLYATGVRTFVEIGPKSVLTGLISAILQDRDVNAWALDASAGKRYGIADLARLLGRLASLGYPVALPEWENAHSTVRKSRMSVLLNGTNYRGHKTPELGMRTRRRPIGRDYAAAKDAECGISAGKEPRPQSDHIQRSQPSQRSQRSQPSKPTNEHNSNMSKDNSKQSAFIVDALKVVEQGLKSMQHLQSQTAAAHQKFLEAQTEANRSLQAMMQNTQRLAEQSLGLYSEPLQPVSSRPLHTGTQKVPPAQEIVSAAVNFDKNSDRRSPQIVPDPLVTPTFSTEEKSSEMAANGYAQASETRETALEEIQPPHQVQQTIETTMLAVVSQLTGYPIEMLGLDMDIEAELGIDSIKRVEILSTLEEKMPDLPTVSPEIMGSLKTLGQIVEYLAESTGSGFHQEETDKTHGSIRADHLEQSQPGWDTPRIPRNVVSIVEAPMVSASVLTIAENRKVFVTEDNTGLAEQIAEELIRSGIGTIRISLDILKYKKQLPAAAGLIIVQDPRSEKIGQNLKDAFVLAKCLAPDLIESANQGGAIFATVTRLDGAFGLKGKPTGQPAQGGLAGLVKTAAIEWQTVCCHAIDIAPDWSDNRQIAGAVVKEMLSPGPVEIGLDSDHRYTVALQPAPYPEGQINLAPGDVIVISGGARGITAAAALALARETAPTLVLLGRSPQPVAEPGWLSPLTDEAAIKKAILTN